MSDPLARLLRRSRVERGLSQLQMSLRLGVSQRHLSFVESARAHPSRALLLAWMREIDADDSLRNAALLHAGYALRSFDVAGRGSAQALAALHRMLELHEPNAGLVFDADWITVELNRGARRLCALLMPGLWCDATRQVDMIAALEHPGGLLAQACEPARAGAALLAQLRAEQWARPALHDRVERLAAALERRYRMPETAPARSPALPTLELRFDTARGRLAFLLAQTVFGLPHDVSVGSLRTELWFPADDATAELMRELSEERRDRIVAA